MSSAVPSLLRANVFSLFSSSAPFIPVCLFQPAVASIEIHFCSFIRRARATRSSFANFDTPRCVTLCPPLLLSPLIRTTVNDLSLAVPFRSYLSPGGIPRETKEVGNIVSRGKIFCLRACRGNLLSSIWRVGLCLKRICAKGMLGGKKIKLECVSLFAVKKDLKSVPIR